MFINQDGYQVTRHVCPRNCYDTCGILAYVYNGRLVNITGDPHHGYTNGKLCTKGYSYMRRVYSPDRIKYPLRQLGRGTGNWQRISWEEALDIICTKILELKAKYGSTLPLCLNKYSGNFGVMHYAIEGLFNSLGPTTQVLGSPCWPAGLDAQYFDLGNNYNSDPKEMENAQTIIIWGANPAWTAIHSLPYIYQAQEKGAKVIVIDPIYSQTAKKADWYIQIKPSQDGVLATALAKIIYEEGLADHYFLENYSLGWEEYVAYLKSFDLKKAAKQCGLKLGLLQDLAHLIAKHSPMFIWIGFGIQRHQNGGQNIRAIDALGALTGNIGKSGGGVHYANLNTWNLFKYNFLQSNFKHRFLNINQFGQELENCQEPPVKLLWISSRNLLRQDASPIRILKALEKIELIITVEQFLTDTAQYSDLVLPTTTFLEAMDIVPSYWHHWIGINEQAIAPYFEAKSDLEIAQLIAQKLNSQQPGSCGFPEKSTVEELLNDELDKNAYKLLGIKHWEDLRTGAVKANTPTISWEMRQFETPSRKYEFYSKRAQDAQQPPLPTVKNGLEPKTEYPYWFLTTHSQHGLNSQFQNIDWIASKKNEPVAIINPKTAAEKNIRSGDNIRIFNDNGSILIKAVISKDTPEDVIVCHQGWFKGSQVNLNSLVDAQLTDMGKTTTGAPGLAFYDTFVNFDGIKKDQKAGLSV